MTTIQPTPHIDLELCPERAVWWARQRTLFVADLHLGRVPSASLGDDTLIRQTLTRLTTVVRRYDAQRIVFLGDMFHMKRHYNAELLAIVSAWRMHLSSLVLLLVRGNHERVLGDPPASLELTCVDPGYCEEGMTYLHEPRIPTGYTLCAHLHPSILVPSARVAAEAVPCFVIGQSYLVIPAFEDLVPGRIIPQRADESYAFIRHGTVTTR
jgi:DNA ligase-associated metallophosphoesterase